MSLAGNGNEPAPSFDFVYDSTPPVPSVSTTAGAYTNVSPIPVDLLFSETVTDFVQTDVSLTNGTVTEGSFSGSGDTYSLTVTPVEEGW